MEHEYFGTIEFEDGYCELKPLSVGERLVTVEMDTEEEPGESELNGLAQACQNHEQWTAQIVAKVHQEFDELLGDGLKVWAGDDPNFLSQFASGATLENLTPQQVTDKLILTDIRLEGDEIALDLQFEFEAMDYLICGRFDPNGTLGDVSLES